MIEVLIRTLFQIEQAGVRGRLFETVSGRLISWVKEATAVAAHVGVKRKLLM